MSQQQPTNVYPYDPTMEYGRVIESPPNSSKSPGYFNITIAIAIAIVIAIAIISVISCLWRRRKDRRSMEAEPQFDQEAPPPEPTGINGDEKKPDIASREWFVFEDGSTSHGRGGPAPPNFGGGYGPPLPNFGRGYGPQPHFGGGYGPPPPYFYG